MVTNYELANKVLELLEDADDVYGIGSMLSQWTGSEKDYKFLRI